jgi:hypothetical protein
MGGRNQDGNGQERCHCRDGTKADSPLHHFLLKACFIMGRDNVVMAIALRGVCVSLKARVVE